MRAQVSGPVTTQSAHSPRTEAWRDHSRTAVIITHNAPHRAHATQQSRPPRRRSPDARSSEASASSVIRVCRVCGTSSFITRYQTPAAKCEERSYSGWILRSGSGGQGTEGRGTGSKGQWKLEAGAGALAQGGAKAGAWAYEVSRFSSFR